MNKHRFPTLFFFVCVVLYFLFSPQFYWETIGINYCIHLRYTTWQLNLHILWSDYHNKLSLHLLSHIDTIKRREKKILVATKTLTNYSFNSFPVFHTAVLNIVIILYIAFLVRMYIFIRIRYISMSYLFYKWKFVSFNPLHPFCPPIPYLLLPSGNHQSVLFIYSFVLFLLTFRF